MLSSRLWPALIVPVLFCACTGIQGLSAPRWIQSLPGYDAKGCWRVTLDRNRSDSPASTSEGMSSELFVILDTLLVHSRIVDSPYVELAATVLYLSQGESTHATWTPRHSGDSVDVAWLVPHLGMPESVNLKLVLAGDSLSGTFRRTRLPHGPMVSSGRVRAGRLLCPVRG